MTSPRVLLQAEGCHSRGRLLEGRGSAVAFVTANVVLTDPLDYMPLVHLMTRCRMVLTDSGGLQQEAPSLGKPVLVMRKTTERREGAEAGSCRSSGVRPECFAIR